jgi:hypothetical protein
MTFHLNFYRPSTDLRYRYPWTFSTSAFLVAGFFWGGALAFLGMPSASVMWFVVAIFASMLAVCIAFYGTAKLRHIRKYQPVLSATGLICISLIIGNWVVGLVISLF